MSDGAIERVYLDHAALLRRIAVRKFGVPTRDAETLVHDVFAAYIANPAAVTSDVRAYLIAAICNASRNYWRSEQIKDRFFVAKDGIESPGPDVGADSFFEGLSLHLVMAATLSRLGERCRRVLHRFYFDGDSAASIAAVEQTTPGNIHLILHTCRKKARQIYKELTSVR